MADAFVHLLRRVGFAGKIPFQSPARLITRLRLLALVGLLGVSVNAAEAPRPNILFAFADDWGRHASAYAQLDGPGGVNDVIRTPNFDRVAREGVLFRRAFVRAPSCTPCRSEIGRAHVCTPVTAYDIVCRRLLEKNKNKIKQKKNNTT